MEQTDSCQRGGSLGSWVKEGQRVDKCGWEETLLG